MIVVIVGIVIVSLGVTLNVQATGLESVDNKADFSTDTIYQVITDRFYDGNIQNNPTGDIFDKSNLRKYHGRDW